MSEKLHPPLGRPKDGHVYEVLAIGRVSDPGPGKQDVRSLDDQEQAHRKWLDSVIGPGRYRLTVVAGSGSGEHLERAEYQRVIELVETGRFDLACCEDLGRIVRRVHAHLFAELCEDKNTRLIAPNDRVDTALPNWREASIFAAFHHERANRDTSERIKRTQRNRFANGGLIGPLTYGWVKPPGAKSDDLAAKDPTAEPVYIEWFRRLDEDEASFAEVTRWLISIGVKFPTRTPGVLVDPDGKSVARLTYNPLLKGVRERNRRKTRRTNKTGKYESVKAAPEELLLRVVPHLAFFQPDYYDRVAGKVRDRNGRYRRSDDPAADPCKGRPRRRSRYPGQATECDVCGRPFVWGGHGQTDHLMCKGARSHRCWNGATFDGVRAAKAIAAAVYDAVETLVEFDPAFLRMVREEGERLDADRCTRIGDVRAKRDRAAAEVANLMRFIKRGDESEMVRSELKLAEAAAAKLGAALAAAEREPSRVVQVPPVERLRELGRACLKDMEVGGEPFARVMRKLVSCVRVFPVQLCDGGAVVLRATGTLQLSELLPEPAVRDALRRPLERPLEIDLFERPQRAAFRERVVALRAAGRTEREVAAELGITVTAAQSAAKLHRRMGELGITDPYVRVTEPTEDCRKRCRHRNASFKFEPIAGNAALLPPPPFPPAPPMPGDLDVT
jgi:site-specific DNA recombinase